MKKTLLILFTFSLLWNCMDDPFENHSLTLGGEAGVTEAWLEVHVEGLKRKADYILQRDGTTVFSGRLQTQDTVLYDSQLSPSTTYRYRLYAREGGENSPAAETGLTTLDTTSHEFDWRVYTFGGQKGSSLFYDVAIIDENDIWAVGQIFTEDTYTYDSLGNFIQPYNAAHWDGEKWTLTRIPTNACGGVKYPPIKSVFNFDDGIVVFGHSDGSLTYYNGSVFKNDCATITQVNVTANKIWGTSSSDFYVVGNSGMMAHYDGTRWTKIETGTELNIRDIWAQPYLKGYQIIFVASDYSQRGRRILSLENGSVSTESSSPISSDISSVWFAAGARYYYLSTGEGIFRKPDLSASAWRKISFEESTRYYINSIRGTAPNDIFLAGHFGEVLHFNGRSFRSYREQTDRGGAYYALSMKNDRVAVAGSDGRAALITVGRRK